MAEFWSRVQKTETCWWWTGAKTPEGYGQVVIAGKIVGAHRHAYELAVGPIPDGLQLDHLCRKPSCVRPDHLEPVTRRVNILRGTSPVARRAGTSHCVKGHEYTPENTVRSRRDGRRSCRECKRASARNGGNRRYYLAHRDQILAEARARRAAA